MHIVLVQLPPAALPPDPAELDKLWTYFERWTRETLDASDLGQCLGLDLASELTSIAEVRDPDRAVDVLAAGLGGSRLPDGVVIAVREDGNDVIKWPAERAGEDLDPYPRGRC